MGEGLRSTFLGRIPHGTGLAYAYAVGLLGLRGCPGKIWLDCRLPLYAARAFSSQILALKVSSVLSNDPQLDL